MVVRKMKNVNVINEGLGIGSSFPEVEVENYAGEVQRISKKTEKKHLFIMLDLNCKECNSVFNSFKAYNQNYLKNVTLVFLKNDFNIQSINKSVYKSCSVFLDENIMLDKFKISGFPFYFQLDNQGLVMDRGYISKYNMIDFIL